MILIVDIGDGVKLTFDILDDQINNLSNAIVQLPVRYSDQTTGIIMISLKNCKFIHTNNSISCYKYLEKPPKQLLPTPSPTSL